MSGLSSNIEKAYSGVKDVLTPAVDGFKAVESVGKKAGNAVIAGAKGFAAAATAVGGFGAAAVQTGMEFDATMSEVSAISGATGDTFDELRKKALSMAASTKFGATEVAKAYTYMGMAGWDAEDMMSGISGILNLAAASGEDLATTSDIVTDALTAFNMTASDSNHFSDVLAATATSANTSVGMMGETFKYVAPVAGALGFTIEDVALAVGLMGNNSIKSSMAGTALRSMMTRMAKPTKESQTAMTELGISLDDGEGHMKSFKEVLDDLRTGFGNLMIPQNEFNERLSSLNTKLEDGTFTQKQYDTEVERLIGLAYGAEGAEKAKYAAMLAGQEAMAGLLAIVSASPEDYEKLTAAIYDCNGAAEKMAATMMDNLAGDLTLVKSAFESLQIAISDSLTPTLREFAQFGQKAMAGLLEGFQSGGVSGFMSALSGIVTDGVAMLVEKAPEFASVSIQFIEAIAEGFLNNNVKLYTIASEIIIMLKHGIDSWLSEHAGELLTSGEMIIDTLFQGFTSAGDIISKYIGDFVPLIAEAFLSYHEALFTVGLDILGAIGRGIIDNKDEIKRIASDTIANMVTAIRDNAPDIIEGGKALLEIIVDAIEENLPLIMEAGAEIIAHLVAGISTASPEVQAIIGTAVLPHIAKIIEAVTGIGDTVGSVAKLVSENIGTVMNIGGKLMGGIQALFSLITAHPIIAVIVAIIAAVTLLWTHCEAFRDAVGKIWEAITGFFETAWKAISDLWNGAGKFFSDIVTDIEKAFDGIVGFFDRVFSDAWDAVKKAWNGTRTFFEEKWDDISGAFKGAKDKFIEIGGNIVGGLKEGIKDKWENFKGFLGTKVGGIIDSAKSKLGINSPSKVFAGIGENMALGLAEGWGGEYDNIKRQIERGLSFGTATIGTETSGLSYGNAATTRPGNFQPLTIIVKPILNEKVIGEASYKYMLDRERAYGGRW